MSAPEIINEQIAEDVVVSPLTQNTPKVLQIIWDDDKIQRVEWQYYQTLIDLRQLIVHRD